MINARNKKQRTKHKDIGCGIIHNTHRQQIHTHKTTHTQSFPSFIQFTVPFPIHHHHQPPSANMKNKEEYWVTSALTNDNIVADFLVRIKQQSSSSQPSTSTTTTTWLTPIRWGHRKSRSKPPSIVANNTAAIKQHQQSGSPTTPLCWSGGAGTSTDGYDESSRSGDRSNKVCFFFRSVFYFFLWFFLSCMVTNSLKNMFFFLLFLFTQFVTTYPLSSSSCFSVSFVKFFFFYFGPKNWIQ